MGFDIQANSSGFGLTSMRQRLSQVGGSLEIETEPGEGATVSARLPAALTHQEVSRS